MHVLTPAADNINNNNNYIADVHSASSSSVFFCAVLFLFFAFGSFCGAACERK